jgi:predicted ATPase/class 3 adenylate cyclase
MRSGITLQGLPTGTVTFLFTDIEGSTSLLQRLGDGYPAVLEEHAGIIRTAVDAADGIVVSTEGDSFFCVFETATHAVQATVAAQRTLQTHAWDHDGSVWVRMGAHTGEGVLGGDNYVGLDVHRAARIAAAAHGGQVLVSDTTRSLAESSMPSGTKFRDLDLHRLKDLERAERLHELLIDGLEQDFPPPRTLEGVEGNLPAQLTSFVGRESEIAEVVRLLSRARLVTLTGTGGVGKTRLAVQAAGSIRERFPDGVWFVPLEEISDPSLLVGAVIEELDLRHMSGDAYAQLVQHLRGRRILLVLDNFEHLIPDGATPVSSLLRDCPDLRILVTSRAPLHLTGEQELRVPPLAGPDDERVDADSDIRDRPAVRLFVERATAVRPDFDLTPENASAVATITQRLDGLPLAIELAAALVSVLSPQAILGRLEGRMDILSGGPQDRPERQRSLRAAIQWSYELLDADHRRLLEELGVFVGGASLTMVERIGSEGGDVQALLGGLRALLDQSLLTRQDVDDEPRFLMVATIREFALEQLEAGGDHEAVRRRHAETFRELAAEAEDGMRGPEEGPWVAVIDREFANLRAAVTWALSVGGVDLALPTVVSLNRYAQLQLREEVARWAEDALELPGARSHPLYAPACGVAAWVRGMQGDLARSSELAERGLSAVDDPDDPARAYPLMGLADVALFDGRLDEALHYAREATRLADRPGDRVAMLVIESLALTYDGDVDGGIEVALRLREHAERERIRSGIAWSYYLEGEALAQRDPERALALFEEAIVVAEQVQGHVVAGVAQVSATSLRARRGDPRKSLEHFRDLIESWQGIGAGAPLWTTMRSVAEVFVRVGSLEVAAVLHAAIMRDDIGLRAFGEDAERLSALAETLREQLSASQLEGAAIRGRSLSEADVIDLAMAEMDRLLSDGT